jgi:hypothetical protein
MKRPALFLSIFATALVALPALADEQSGLLNHRFGKNTFNFDHLPSGPQPLRNLSRRPDGIGNNLQLVGDYHNPILTPYAATVVKQKGELALAGKGFPNAQDQCRQPAPPMTLAMKLTFEMLQTKNGDIDILYGEDVRHIRMNSAHPANLKPTHMGDAVGHWDRDSLVIDTVAIKSDAYSSVDRFGTPQSELMHVIERYRLVDGAVSKAGTDRFEQTEGHVGGGGRAGGGRNPEYSPDLSLKGVELDVTMEDPKVFTAPLTGRVTYRPVTSQWEEDICADNPVEHYKNEWIGLPRAERPDF